MTFHGLYDPLDFINAGTKLPVPQQMLFLLEVLSAEGKIILESAEKHGQAHL